MSASRSAVKSRAEAIKISREFDYLILFTAFFVILGGYHIHYMLTGGDWDFWSDWKDRRLWVTVAPIVAITFPAAVQASLWGRYRIPWGATVCVLGLLLGEWVNRYFNFWGWTYFPVNFVFPSNLVPGAIVLDVILMMTGSYTVTAVIGGLGWGLIFYPGNWPIIAPLHVPVEYNGMMFTLADLQGYHYVRTGTPEYIRLVEKGTLRTFGKDVAPVSAFFSGFVCIIMYFLWHFFGEWFGSTRFVLVGSASSRDKNTLKKENDEANQRRNIASIKAATIIDSSGPSESVDAHPKSPTKDRADPEAPPSRQIQVTGHSASGVPVELFQPETEYMLKFRVAAPSGGNLAKGEVDVTSVPKEGLAAHWVVVSENVEFLVVSSGGAIKKLGGTCLAEFDLKIPGQGDSATVELDVRTTKVSGELTLILLVSGKEYRKLTVSLDKGAHVKSDDVCTDPNHLSHSPSQIWAEPPEHLQVLVLSKDCAHVTSLIPRLDYGVMECKASSDMLTNPIQLVQEMLNEFRVAAEDHLNNLNVDDMKNRIKSGQWKSSDWGHLPYMADADHNQEFTTSPFSEKLCYLANAGYALFKACFPEVSELHNIIKKLTPGSRLDFIWTSRTSADWVSHVPWALMYLELPDMISKSFNVKNFLGLRYRIGSNSWNPKKPSPALGDPSQANSLHFLYWGSHSKDEVGVQSRWQQDEFGKWGGRHHFIPKRKTDNPKQQVVKALQNPQPEPASIIYFYCKSDSTNSSNPALNFGDPVPKSGIVKMNELHQGKLEANPFVFANACNTSVAHPQGTSALEQYFFDRDIRAFLGTEAYVPVYLASHFAWLFFQFFLRKADTSPITAGEALAQTRLFLWTQYRNPGGLFYSLTNNYDLSLATNEELTELKGNNK